MGLAPGAPGARTVTAGGRRERRAGSGSGPGRGVPAVPSAAAQVAWLTVDMWKSGTRIAGMAVRVK